MYSAIIVEDEHLIRKWLAYVFDYNKLGIDILGDAENGYVGAQMIHKYMPDIVITDITMPIYNAFEMFENTKSLDYKKIIISGYNDFDNAKLALHYGVRDFITKPIVTEELYSSLLDLTVELNHQDKEHTNKKLKIPINSNNSVINTIITEVQNHYQEKVTVTDIAKMIDYSESYLYKYIKDNLGMTLNDYLNRYRIKKAIDLLIKNTDLKAYEVAELIGFSDYNYFNKVFKKYIGLNVTDFKKQLKSK